MLGPERKARPLPDIGITRPSAVEAVIRRSANSGSDPAAAEDASKKALAANLEGMIQGMLCTTQFATAATARTRSWSRQIGEVSALDASMDDSAFTASSLLGDVRQVEHVPASTIVAAAAPRRWWIDAVLLLACLISVVSAGYFTFTP